MLNFIYPINYQRDGVHKLQLTNSITQGVIWHVISLVNKRERSKYDWWWAQHLISIISAMKQKKTSKRKVQFCTDFTDLDIEQKVEEKKPKKKTDKFASPATICNINVMCFPINPPYLQDLLLRFIQWISRCINGWFCYIVTPIITQCTTNVLQFSHKNKTH